VSAPDQNDVSRLLAAEAVALRAGMLTLDYFRSAGLERLHKGPQNFVSEADIEVESLIRETITKAFPEDSMLGEEDGLRAGTSGYTWVVDPIDGTTNFLDGLPGWVVSVAVLKGDIVKVGVIQDPCAGEIFTAHRGGGTRLNGRLLPLLKDGSLSSSTVGIGASLKTQPGSMILD
jgi:myo-inositol-1(or 4)-monophosphatase